MNKHMVRPAGFSKVFIPKVSGYKHLTKTCRSYHVFIHGKKSKEKVSYMPDYWVYSQKKIQLKRPSSFIRNCLLRDRSEEPSPAVFVDVSAAMTGCLAMLSWWLSGPIP